MDHRSNGFGAVGLSLLCALSALAAPASLRADDSRVEKARTLFEAGQRAYEAERFAEAANKMQAAYELTKSPELAFNAGRVYERMSEYDLAIRFFRIYLKRGQPSEAERQDLRQRIAALRSAKRRQRDQVFTAPPSRDALTAEARTFFKRGVAMFKRRQYAAAMQAFTAAHRFAPLPEVLYNMAVTAERLERTRDAIDFYREYLRRSERAADRHAVEKRIGQLRRQR
jgi:tetratricopeptide (TPR) repeat protein